MGLVWHFDKKRIHCVSKHIILLESYDQIFISFCYFSFTNKDQYSPLNTASRSVNNKNILLLTLNGVQLTLFAIYPSKSTEPTAPTEPIEKKQK